MRFYLDTESTGLMGPLNLIQIGDSSRIVFIRPFIEDYRLRLTALIDVLNDPDNKIILYNSKHDIWKLYCLLEPKEPFKAKFIDLLHLVQTTSELAPFMRKRLAKSVVLLKGIDTRVADVVAEYVSKKITSLCPHGIEVSASTHKKKKGFVDISFSSSVDSKLKNVIYALFPAEREGIQKIADVWHLIPDEKKYLPGMEESRLNEYREMFEKNEALLEDEKTLRYAENDIRYLRLLDERFGYPEQSLNDICSEILAWTRYKGFDLDVEGVKQYAECLRAELTEIEKHFPGVDMLSPSQRKDYMNAKYGLDLKSTGKKSLKFLKRKLQASKEVADAGDGIFETVTLIEKQAEVILEDVRRIEQYNALFQRYTQACRLAEAGRAHPDFNVIGAKSGRMSGAGGLNYQGIDRSKKGMRRFFKVSQGGDFDSLEMNLAAYLYDDKQMQVDLKSTDMHLQTSLPLLSPPIPYDEALLIKDDEKHGRYSEIKAKRQTGKTINFSMLYWGSQVRVRQVIEEADIPNAGPLSETIHKNFLARYSDMQKFAKRVEDGFCTLDVNDWSMAREDVARMETSIANCFGFQRRFDFEKMLCNLFITDTGIERAARKQVDELGLEDERIVRSEHKGEQSIPNSVMSARYGAALNIQRAVFRQAGNHVVQSSGAELTKRLMALIWNRFRVPMMNIHDEIVIPAGYEHLVEEIRGCVNEFLIEYRKIIPTLGMKWAAMRLWSEK